MAGVHVFPRHEHETHGLTCWCRPTLYRICPECDGEGLLGLPDEDEEEAAWSAASPAAEPTPCWRCQDSLRTGLIPVSMNEARGLQGSENLIVVHHRVRADDVMPVSEDEPNPDVDEDGDSPADRGDDDGLAGGWVVAT